MIAQPPMNAEERRSTFIGRVQEQRQFQVALQGLLAHHRRWRELADQVGADFDPEEAPGDDSYARVFLPHGIGGIGKSWLTRRWLHLAQQVENDAAILILYDDLSLGQMILEPVHLMHRLYSQLVRAGYEQEVAPYRQAQASAPQVAERVARYKAENRERWEALVQTASALISRGTQAIGTAYGLPIGENSAAFIQTASGEVIHEGAAALAKAHDLLMERMQQEGQLEPDEAPLFRDPLAAQAAKLVAGLKRIALQQPLVIALDTLEVIVPLEPFLRDYLVLPAVQAPILWVLSGRYNLADERVVEVKTEPQIYKGYRDLLGQNPPVAWDLSVFGDADIREYLLSEAQRRGMALPIDDDLIAAVKQTSGGVPLAVEMATDALFALDHQAFLEHFVLDDKTLLPAGRLEQVTARFLRYCLTHPDDLERVQSMALLRKDADERALRAVWALPESQRVGDVLHALRTRYAFVRAEGLHDAVYEFVRRELRTLRSRSESRERLSRRAVQHCQAIWEREHDTPDDPALRTRDPRWQTASHDVLNALLWADPDQAARFLLPRFVEGLGFDQAFAKGLLAQAEEFSSENTFPLRRADADRLHRLGAGLNDIGRLDRPGETVGPMAEMLLRVAGLEPLHLAILHLWRGRWLAEGKQYDDALQAYQEAEPHLPGEAAELGGQLADAFNRVGWEMGWERGQAIPSPDAELALNKAVILNETEGRHWVGLGVMKYGLKKNDEAVEALSRGIQLEGEKAYSLNWLGAVYAALGRHDEAIAAFQRAVELYPQYATPWNGLGNVYRDLGRREEAVAAFQRALELDPKLAAPWNGLGAVYRDLGRREEAVTAFQRALELDPKDASPWNNLGAVYHDLGRHDEAVAAYQHAAELDPKYATPWNNRGNVYRDLGRRDEAIAAYQRAIELDPQYAYPWNGLGNVYADLGRRDEAVAAYQRALELDPKYAAPWNNLGNVYRDLGRHDEAVTAYQRALELDPRDATLWNGLGVLYELQGQLEDALHAHRRAVELQPENGMRHGSLASVLRKLGRQAEAAEHLARAHELTSPGDQYNRACLEAIAGNVDAALEYLTKALVQAPGTRTWARRDPDLAALHGDPRFEALVG